MADTYMADTKKPPDRPSLMSPAEMLALFHAWWNLDWAHCSKWHKQARADFDFTVGHGQWDDGERKRLEDEKRAPTVFNRTLVMLKAVAGIEVNARHQIVFLPREGVADEQGRIKVKANETLSAASRWMDDTAFAEDHQSTAFQDCSKTGMGWTEPLVGYDDDPKGLYYEQRVSPLEMVWDYRARAKNLMDAQRLWRIKRMLKSTARTMFPDADEADINCPWVYDSDGKPVIDDPAQRHKRDADTQEHDPQQEVFVIHVQWWEYEPFWLVAHQGATEAPETLTDEQFTAFRKQLKEVEKQAKAAGMPFDFPYSATKGRRKVYRQAFIGKVVLGEVKEPQDPTSFTWKCVTGEPDETKGYWFGLVALVRDPQKFANLCLSQTAHILNSTAKGGIIAETDAFDDQRQAEETYARPDAITWARSGAIRQQKIMPKPGVGMAAGHVNMLEFAIASIRDCMGINLELLGLRDANQPGILEAQRKQAAMTILATLFDSLRLFRKLIGMTRLELVQRYLADDRMVLIKGRDGYELLQLMRQRVLGKYWVVVSDAPSSPNQKQETWAVLRDMLPALKELLTPEVVMVLLEYAPIPSELLEALRKLSQQPPSPEEQQQQALVLEAGKAKIEKDKASAQKAKAGAVLDLANAAATTMEARLQAAQAAIAEQLAGQRLPDDMPLLERTGMELPSAPMPVPSETTDRVI